MQYPGRVIKAGEQDANIVEAVKSQLNATLAIEGDPALRLDVDDPTFDTKMKRAVKLFQARNVDADGRPLKQDGEVGSLTWAALFGHDTVPVSDASSDELLARVLQIAAAEEAKQVREIPKNSNRGPEVDVYLRRAGVEPGLSWCCAFVYWCFDEAAQAGGGRTPWSRRRAAWITGAARLRKARRASPPHRLSRILTWSNQA